MLRASAFAALFPIQRSDDLNAFERYAEGVRQRVTGREGDIVNRHFGFLEQLTGVFDALALNVGAELFARLLFEERGKILGGQAQIVRHAADGHVRVGVMRIHVIVDTLQNVVPGAAAAVFILFAKLETIGHYRAEIIIELLRVFQHLVQTHFQFVEGFALFMRFVRVQVVHQSIQVAGEKAHHVIGLHAGTQVAPVQFHQHFPDGSLIVGHDVVSQACFRIDAVFVIVQYVVLEQLAIPVQVLFACLHDIAHRAHLPVGLRNVDQLRYWRYEDGKMIKAELTDEYMQALDISRELYAMGAIHPEFSIRQRADYEGDFIQGKAGVYFNTSTDITAFQSQMVQPEAVLHSKNVFQNADGNTYTAAGRGNNGVLLFSKKAIPDKETLDKVINIFDRLADQEMCNLLALGVEGKNYEVVDGVAHMLPDEDGSIKSFYTNSIYNPYTIPLAVRWPNLRTIPVELDYGAQRNLEIIEENAPYAVADDSLGLISELYSELGSDLDTLMSDAKTLYIMGEIDKAEFQNRMEQWRKQGGDDIAEEYARLYEENRM